MILGYFSELQITWMERQEQLFSHSMPTDDSYLSPVLQMRGKLNELKTQLQDYIFWDNLYSFQKGRAFRDAFTLSHLQGKALHHFSSLSVDLLQMGV